MTIVFDAEFEDTVLAQSLRNADFLKRSSRICQAHHFSTKERAWVWDVTFGVWSKYRERVTPKIMIARAIDDHPDRDKRKPYLALGRKLFRLKPKSPRSVLDELDKFVRHVGVQLAIEESAELLEKGKVDEAESTIAKASRNTTRERNYTHIPWIEEFEDRQSKRKYEREHPDAFTTIPFGFPRLDHVFGGGGRKGEVILIQGTTGRGKSIFLNNFCQSAISRGYNGIYFGFEMPAHQIAQRQDSRSFQMRYNQFKSFDFKPSELRQLKRQFRKAKKQYANRLHIVSMPVRSANINDVRNAIEDIRQDFDFDPAFICFDSADHLRALDNYGGSFRLQQAEVYWGIKELGMEDGYLIVSSTHAGKEWATKIATAEASSESYDKSRIADGVMSLNDPAEMQKKGRKTVVTEDDEDDDDDDDEIEEPAIQPGMKRMILNLGKYRDGESRLKIELECDFARMTMKEAETKDEDDDDDKD